MRKLSILLVGLLFIGLSCVSAFASVTPGMWTLDTGISNGFWGEIFETSNQPGSGGNALVANDSGQWAMWGQSQSAGVSSDPDYDYETPYTGTIYLAPDADKWGDGLNFVNFSGINYSTGGEWGSGLDFKFTVFVIDNNYRYDLVAEFNSASENVNYVQLYDKSFYVQHGGGGFDSIKLNVSPVPIPGTLWLLGSGIIGIVGIRRKFGRF
jgi:hypothetical protein